MDGKIPDCFTRQKQILIYVSLNATLLVRLHFEHIENAYKLFSGGIFRFNSL